MNRRDVLRVGLVGAAGVVAGGVVMGDDVGRDRDRREQEVPGAGVIGQEVTIELGMNGYVVTEAVPGREVRRWVIEHGMDRLAEWRRVQGLVESLLLGV